MRQELLHDSHVMVVGCGALGNEVMKNLVLMGIGHLVIVDFDVVEMGNLTRSVLYRRRDVGLPKVEVARKALLDINPDLDIVCINGDIAYDVGLNTIRQMDIIVGCVDSRWARYCIQRLCLRVGKTWVDGGIINLEGTARVFRPGCTCYACALGTEGLREMQRRMPCSGIIQRQEQAGHAPTTPIIASIIGAVQAQEAVRVLGDGCRVMVDTLVHHSKTNHQHPTSITQHPKMFYYEGESMTARTPLLEAWDDDCPLHDEWPLDDMITIDGLSDRTAAELLDSIETQQSTEPQQSAEANNSLPAIILNEPFVDYIVDRRSDERYNVMLPAHQVEAFVTSHPLLRHRLLSDFYQHEHREVNSDFPYLNLTIQQLGFPHNDIVRVRTSSGICYIS